MNDITPIYRSIPTPAISVVLPVYNCERFIIAAVESILRQTFTDFEFIIIDDGSKDGSGAILQRFAQHDKRIRLVSRPNKGLVATLNEGLEMARSPLVARMDGDDVAMSDRFEKQIRVLEADSSVVCVGGSQYIIDVPGRILRLVEPPANDADVQKLLLSGHAGICHPASMFRREVALKVGAYRQEFWPAEDLDLWLRMGEHGKLKNIPDVVLKYRVRPDSISEMDGVKQRDKARLACAEAWTRRGIQGTFTAGDPWRAGKSRQRQYQHLLSYGWSAYDLSEWRTAFIYGMKAALKFPHRADAWKLVACATVKHKNSPPAEKVST